MLLNMNPRSVRARFKQDADEEGEKGVSCVHRRSRRIVCAALRLVHLSETDC